MMARTITKITRILLAAASFAYLAAFLGVAAARLGFPYELEWVEGSFLVAAQRVLDGLPLYTAPSVEYVPLVYTPLYLYLSAAAARLTGIGFLPLRLVSLLASLGCLAALFLWASRETRSRLAGLLAAGFFAACYNLSNTWFDLARVDMLFLCFLLWGVYLLRFAESYPVMLAAGACFALSFLSKQTAAGFFAPLLLLAFFVNQKRQALALTAWTALLIGVSVAALNTAAGGWFAYIVFGLPQNHDFSAAFALYYLLKDLLFPFALAWLLILLSLLLEFKAQRGSWRPMPGALSRRGLIYDLSFAALAVAGSGVARANLGGEVNTLLPMLSALALWFGLAAAHLLEMAAAAPRYAAAAGLLVGLALLGQFALLAYNPLHRIPSAEQRAAGDQLVAAVRQVDGEVFIPAHNYIGLLAGKPTYAHTVTIEELAGYFGSRPQDSRTSAILRELEAAFQQKRFALVILDNPDGKLFPQPPAGYRQTDQYAALSQADVFFSVSPYKPKTQLEFFVPQ